MLRNEATTGLPITELAETTELFETELCDLFGKQILQPQAGVPVSSLKMRLLLSSLKTRFPPASPESWGLTRTGSLNPLSNRKKVNETQ